MKLPATFYDQFRDNKVVSFIFGKRSQSNDIEVRIPTPNAMAMQSFALYLESYMTVLLADGLDYITYFQCVTTLFKQHCEVKIMRHDCLRHERIHGTDKVSNIITTYILRKHFVTIRDMPITVTYLYNACFVYRLKSVLISYVYIICSEKSRTTIFGVKLNSCF